MGCTGSRDTEPVHKTTRWEGKQDSPPESSLDEHHQTNCPGSDKHARHRGGLNRKCLHHGCQKTPQVHTRGQGWLNACTHYPVVWPICNGNKEECCLTPDTQVAGTIWSTTWDYTVSSIGGFNEVKLLNKPLTDPAWLGSCWERMQSWKSWLHKPQPP